MTYSIAYRTVAILLSVVMSQSVMAAQIGDWVWEDTNENGIQDGSEVGVANAVVNLQDCSGNVLQTFATTSGGFYRFRDLAAGDYRIEYILPAGFVFSPTGQTNSVIDSDADQVTGLSACISYTVNQSNRYVDAGLIRQGNNTAPEVTITAPADGSNVGEGDTISLVATATDAEDDDTTLVINWDSDLDGSLGSGNTMNVSLSVGTHTVTASVTDSGSVSDSASISITVNAGNTAPVATITAPSNGTTVDDGTSLTFSGTATDTEDDDSTLILNWSSDLDGDFGAGTSVAVTLSIGTHTITASTVDSEGLSGSTTISVTVASTNTAPLVTISTPADGTSINQLASLTFAASATDFEDDDTTLAIDWSSNIDGSLGTGDSVVAVLSVGTHLITASVTDSDNLAGTDTVTVTVISTAPIVTITAPADGTSVIEGETLTFTATATDAEDDDSSLIINWTSDIDGDFGSGTSIDATLSIGTHAVTASSTDSDGLTTSATVDVSFTALISGPPNILLIIADDMGIDASSSYDVGGESKAPTPTLDTLANEGIVFDNVWANPLCTPTRATLLTGRYGYRTNVVSPSPPGNVLSGSQTVLQVYLDTNAPSTYNQAVFGKWHVGGNGRSSAPHPFRSGIPEYRGIIGGGVPDYYNWTINNLDSSTETTTVYATTRITDFAIDWLNEPGQQDNPWFLWMAYNAPHGPFQLPPNDLHDYDYLAPGTAPSSNILPYYQAMIQALDSEIGRLLDSMDPAERDNTVIIFIGDNGTPVPAAQAWIHEAKGTAYESGIRVPMIVSGRGVTRANEREGALVVTTDLFATVAELAGVPINQINDSFSFASLLDDASATNGRDYAYTEVCTTQLDSWTIRNDQFKLIENRLSASELYDLDNDLLEQNNLYDSTSDPDAAAAQIELEAQMLVIRTGNAPVGCTR